MIVQSRLILGMLSLQAVFSGDCLAILLNSFSGWLVIRHVSGICTRQIINVFFLSCSFARLHERTSGPPEFIFFPPYTRLSEQFNTDLL